MPKECDHQKDRIQDVVVQAPDGHWYATFATPTGSRLVLAVTNCPWCGVDLWGKPPDGREPSPPAIAHASRPNGGWGTFSPDHR